MRRVTAIIRRMRGAIGAGVEHYDSEVLAYGFVPTRGHSK